MPRDRRVRTTCHILLASLPFVAAPASAQGRARLVAVRALDTGDASVVEVAQQGRWPGSGLRSAAGCSRTSPTDRAGRSRRSSRASRFPPDEFLAILPLLDGSERPLCQAHQSHLLTTAGVPRVFVCKSFLKAVYQERVMAEVYLIHELLHTLGLGENPPSSQQITRQVERRCAP